MSYYIMVISKMAAKMAAVTPKLAYLLNYLLQISREGVYHWVFWRHSAESTRVGLNGIWLGKG